MITLPIVWWSWQHTQLTYSSAEPSFWTTPQKSQQRDTALAKSKHRHILFVWLDRSHNRTHALAINTPSVLCPSQPVSNPTLTPTDKTEQFWIYMKKIPISHRFCLWPLHPKWNETMIRMAGHFWAHRNDSWPQDTSSHEGSHTHHPLMRITVQTQPVDINSGRNSVSNMKQRKNPQSSTGFGVLASNSHFALMVFLPVFNENYFMVKCFSTTVTISILTS